jgi:hypothetical protein
MGLVFANLNFVDTAMLVLFMMRGVGDVEIYNGMLFIPSSTELGIFINSVLMTIIELEDRKTDR